MDFILLHFLPHFFDFFYYPLALVEAIILTDRLSSQDGCKKANENRAHKNLKKGENQSELMPANECSEVARRRKTSKVEISAIVQQEFLLLRKAQ